MTRSSELEALMEEAFAALDGLLGRRRAKRWWLSLFDDKPYRVRMNDQEAEASAILAIWLRRRIAEIEAKYPRPN